MIKKVIDQTHNFQLKRRIENLAEKNGSKKSSITRREAKRNKKKNKSYLNSSITRRRNDVLIVKVNYIDSGPVTDQYSLQGDVSRRIEVPYSDRTVLRTSDHDTILKA